MEDVMMKGCKVDEEKIVNINDTFKCNEDATLKEDEVESTKSEMTGVREENIRLKTMLEQIEKDYKTLQMQFMDILQQKSKKTQDVFANHVDHQEQELVSLRLGTTDHHQTKKDNTDHVKINSQIIVYDKDDVTELGLGYNNSPERLKSSDDGPVSLGKNQGPDNNHSLTGQKEDGDQDSITSKGLKTQRGGDDEFCQTTSVKRARVCVRAKCDTPTMNDGCQWRKYGQKVAKGNPCPRAYYRCTVSQSCPVRKQVQRCLNDKSILITTYEGTHNHPLPVSATAMASTTSAAASMLLSGSTASPAASPPLNLYGPPANYWHNSSATAPFSTVTLDLTTNPAAAHGGFSLYSSSPQLNPRAPTTSLGFSSLESNMVPSIWGGGGGFSNYNDFQNYNLLPGRSAHEQNYLSVLEKLNPASSQQSLTETLSRAITSDPSFRSVIAAVISTMAANGGAGKSEQ